MAPDLRKQLKDSLERYELLYRATNDIIYDLDIVSGSVTWNDALYTVYGFARSEPCNTLEWWSGHIHPDDALEVGSALDQLMTSNDLTISTEYRFHKADGSYAYVRDRGLVQRDAAGTPVRIIGSLLDITREKQLERAKDEFISLVSHQLRTPLSIIRMFSGMIESAGPLNDRQIEYATAISQASVRMISLVGDILDVSRIQLGQMSVVPEPADANSLIATHIAAIQPTADAKKVTIHFKPVDDLEPIPLDPLIFGQILSNLLANAVRYTEEGKGKIEVSFYKRENDFTLEVSDNGIGIPPEAAKHIFNRFYRADNAIGFIGEGTGLGLYLVKLLIDLFKGHVEFKSTLRQGSTFYVRIPLIGMTAISGRPGLELAGP